MQEPREADYPQMPLSALMNMRVDHCLRLAEAAALLVRLAGERIDLQK